MPVDALVISIFFARELERPRPALCAGSPPTPASVELRRSRRHPTSELGQGIQMAVAAAAAPAAKLAYDVAISFVFRDQSTAQALHDELVASGLEVFFFPRRQEELAGTNGMESMRAPFLGARVNVVLFREPWGQTPWTRVEDTAISERCFKGGWSSLMFVQLDKTSPLPAWLPPMHVRFSFEDFGLTQLVGAIKLRVQEQGGVIKRVDAKGKAEAVKREADYLADRDRLMRDAVWIQELNRSVRQTMDDLARLASEIKASQGLDIVAGPGHFG
jgi:hypothetical protein